MPPHNRADQGAHGGKCLLSTVADVSQTKIRIDRVDSEGRALDKVAECVMRLAQGFNGGIAFRNINARWNQVQYFAVGPHQRRQLEIDPQQPAIRDADLDIVANQFTLEGARAASCNWSWVSRE